MSQHTNKLLSRKTFIYLILLVFVCIFSYCMYCRYQSKKVHLDDEPNLNDLAENTDTSFENVDVISAFDTERYDKINVYINAGTATGISFTVLKENQTIFNDLLSMVLSNDYQYMVADNIRVDMEYAFSLTLLDSATDLSVTFFVFGDDTIRLDGQFMKISPSLDFSAVNNALYWFRHQS